MELNENDRDHFEWAFSILVDDKDGNVTHKELARVVRCLGKTANEAQINAMINEVDEDGNGFIDIHEFTTALARKLTDNLDDDEVREAFRIYDKDNTGFISLDHLRSVFWDLDQMIGEEEVDEMIRFYDVDGDGLLSYEEFVQALTTR
ncbi:hypothetical protein KR044_004231 [Drosophila immigrans]|nr:hypothetical protein KR044_004231 [Drosophila immigrans]